MDRRGIWCGCFSLRPKLLPWDAVLAARKATWEDPEGEHEGVLLGLDEGAAHPSGADSALHRSECQRLLGTVEYANPLLLAHDEWDWQPDDLVALISRCIEDAAAREGLGEH